MIIFFLSLLFSRSSSFFSSLPLFLCYTFLFFFLSLTLCHSLFFTLLLFPQLLLSLFFLTFFLSHSLFLSPFVSLFHPLSSNHILPLPFVVISPPLSSSSRTYFFLPYSFLFFLFVCYVRLCTAGNRLSVYSSSVSAVLRASPLRPRISRKTTRFIHGDHRFARFADTHRRN